MNSYPTYKDSGIEWVGEIPEHWEINQIKRGLLLLTDYDANGSFSTIKSNVNRVEKKEEKYSWLVRATDLEKGSHLFNSESSLIWVDKSTHEFLRKSFLEGGELLIAKRGEIGKIYLMPKVDYPATLGPNMYLARLNSSKLQPDFSYYFFLTPIGKEQLAIRNKSTTIGALYKDDFKDILIFFPSPAEQTQIANFLNQKTTELDTAIEQLQQLIALLQEERSSLINEAVTKGIDPDVPMKDSGIEWIGEVPEHWEVVKLKHVLKSLDHIRIPLSSEIRGAMTNKIYHYYGASGVIDKVEDYLFEGDNILIGEDGANLVTRSKRLAFIASGKYWVNNHAHILSPINGELVYFTELLELIDYTIYISGSAQPKLTQENLQNIIVLNPPKEEQQKIVQHIKQQTTRIDTEIDYTQQEITLLQEYKQSLITEAVTGKIDVRGWDEEKVNKI